MPTAPQTEITGKGDIVYTEVSRQNVRKLESYVKGEFDKECDKADKQRWLLAVPSSRVSTLTKSSLTWVSPSVILLEPG